MRFSLVLATYGRTAELARFLAALDAQTDRDFELIVVDQNEDERLLPFLSSYRERFPIRHLRSSPGLSRARNVALPYAAGEIVAFPDDDCVYPPDLLARTSARFRDRARTHGIIVRPIGEDGATLLNYDRGKPARPSRLNLFGRAISYTIFLRREVVAAVGDFDESLGLGARTSWGAGEDIDYPIRALDAGFELSYVRELAVVHPANGGVERALQRAFSYAAGFGRVCRKHHFPAWFMGYHVCRSTAGILIGLSSGRPRQARVHWRALRGKIHGWLAPV